MRSQPLMPSFFVFVADTSDIRIEFHNYLLLPYSVHFPAVTWKFFMYLAAKEFRSSIEVGRILLGHYVLLAPSPFALIKFFQYLLN